MKKVYVDTNIFLDYFLNRSDRLRPLGEFAFNVFKKAFLKELKIVISDWTLSELESSEASEEDITVLLDGLKNSGSLEVVKLMEEDRRKARKILKESGLHTADALHVALAVRSGADVLVTRNIKDFAKAENLIESVLPEEIWFVL